MGNVAATCRALKIDRSTFYDWKNSLPEFALAVAHVAENLLGLAENELLKLIKSGQTVPILFYLKTKGKSRGYVESPNVIQVQRTLGAYKPGDDPEEYIQKALEAAGSA